MNHTKQFIEDAIEGGWKLYAYDVNEIFKRELVFRVLLDPLAWQAVGKTRGWEESKGNGEYPVFRDEWHAFIDELMKKKTIEESLSTEVGERTGEAIAVIEVQEVVRKIKALTKDV